MDRYTFQLGNFQCKVLSDRTYQGPMDLSKMFPNVSHNELNSTLDEYGVDQENITFCFNCLFVDTGQTRVIIDTGIGQDKEGRFLEHLMAEGIEPDSIDHIVFTHGHADHIGGITDESRGLIFSNAKYWMSKAEWEFWADEASLDAELPHAAEGARKNLPPIADQINLIENEGALFEGFSIIHIPGHTIGMMAILIESNSEKLLVAADVFHRPFQVEYTDWNVAADRVPELAPGARKKLIECAISEGATVLVYHFPHPGLGTVKPKGNTWMWEPLSS